MPAALPVDKQLVKQLYISGLTQAEIAKRLGLRYDTVCQWVCRGGWKSERVAEPVSEEVAIQQTAKALSEKATKIAERIMCKLDGLPIKTLGDCKAASSALATAYASARKSLGLDAPGGASHIHLHMTAQSPMVRAPINISAQVTAPVDGAQDTSTVPNCLTSPPDDASEDSPAVDNQ